MPNHLSSKMKSDRASGTVVLLVMPSRYWLTIPSRTRLVDIVTISGLRSRTATRIPLTRPMMIASTSTVDDGLGETVVGALRDADDHVRQQRDARADREVDPAHHDHEHLAERDDRDRASDREQHRSPGHLRDGVRLEHLAEQQQDDRGDPDRCKACGEQQVAEDGPHVEAATRRAAREDVRACDVMRHGHPQSLGGGRTERTLPPTRIIRSYTI